MNINYHNYYEHLHKISKFGRAYKRLFIAPILFVCARKFGSRIVEIGTGVGSGLIGAFPKKVLGLEINPKAVEFCQNLGFNVNLIEDQKPYPLPNSSVDVCVLDNVLEHLEKPDFTLKECKRIVCENGGLIIVVPGYKGYASDSDHKIFYEENELHKLSNDWKLVYLFSTPFFVKSKWLSRNIKQYCLVACYQKVS